MSIGCMWIRKSHVGSTLEGIEIVTDAPLDRWKSASTKSLFWGKRRRPENNVGR